MGTSTYIYQNTIHSFNNELSLKILKALDICKAAIGGRYNLIRLNNIASKIAFLNYPLFLETPFPILQDSWLVDLDSSAVTYRCYKKSLNPPIFHRKELLLPLDHPRRAEFAVLTKMAEDIGLFDDPKRIGYKRQWFALIREKGYRLEGHTLVPLGNDESDDIEDDSGWQSHSTWQASRHLTALVRYGFSAPVQSLARYGLLAGQYSLFDYGCGRGDDIRGLAENGLTAAGWDPHYAPNNPLHAADIVNLGFVVNVIEDFDERIEAITRAWSLAERLLVVSVMLVNQNAPRGRLFRDGVMTARGTFQKYYSQSEIKAFLEQVVDEEPIPVAPGVLYIFRDKEMEQRFLMERYRSRRNRLRSPSTSPAVQPARRRRDRAMERYLTYQEPLDRLWNRWLELGRKPDKSEVKDLVPLLQGFQTLPKAMRFIASRNDVALLETAAVARTADLQVYFAQNLFERRQPYKHLDRGLQRDIKAFFGSYAAAQEASKELLFSLANLESINEACRDAAEHGLGWFEESESLQLHVSLVEQLPSILRVYLGCAAVLYGDYRNADLVKIHIRSGKVSLMRYDDFTGKPLPRMIERVKIKMRELDVDFFMYGEEYESPFLYHKSRYINEEFPYFPEQQAFEEELENLGLFDLTGYGPRASAFLATLEKNRWDIHEFTLLRSQSIPVIEASCGQYFTYRDLIACGETQQETGLENLPEQAETYTALHDLAVQILDPVIEYFGMIRLTFGFCSPALARRIPGRIDPKRDQHAAHELNRRRNLVCPRLGAAADFLVEDENMLEVAQWVVQNTSFDRLYYYGEDRPIHVSYGPNQDRQIVSMLASKTGRRVPKVISLQDFLHLR